MKQLAIDVLQEPERGATIAFRGLDWTLREIVAKGIGCIEEGQIDVSRPAEPIPREHLEDLKEETPELSELDNKAGKSNS